MTEIGNSADSDAEQDIEVFPVEPRYHPVNRVLRGIYDFLASAKLAIFLLVVILLCCLAGTTVYRGQHATVTIFSTLWFNFLLVMLIVNVACCFFGRIWGRRVTLISFGMILFHLSFVAVFVGIIYNSLFFFRGSLRLTEGESLPIADLQSYDVVEYGRFFKFLNVKGEASLKKLHVGYMADGKDKRVAYEISVGSGPDRHPEMLYVTKSSEYRGYRFFPDKEGYSALTVIYDTSGRELYGIHLPLQSLKQRDTSFLYTTGTKEGPAAISLPLAPAKALLNLNVTYRPDPKHERSGEAFFQGYPSDVTGNVASDKPDFSGKARIGDMYDAGSYILSVKEIRYWAAMAVRYEPGQPIILSSLWVGLFGVTLTTLARIFKKNLKRGFLLDKEAL